eukprot:6904123-Prymnesium_polylepis.1
MPSPAAKPGPIHGMGRAVSSEAHALKAATGPQPSHGGRLAHLVSGWGSQGAVRVSLRAYLRRADHTGARRRRSGGRLVDHQQKVHGVD